MSEKKKEFEHVIINGVRIPILGELNSETDRVEFFEGAEEYLENLKKNITEKEKEE